MKVRMIVGLSGVDYVYRKGEVVDLPDPKALRLLRSGMVELVKSIRETAQVIKIEKAVDVLQAKDISERGADKPDRSESASKGNRKRGRKPNK